MMKKGKLHTSGWEKFDLFLSSLQPISQKNASSYI